MGSLPSGTVTFLFTDIEGSTQLAQEYPEEMPLLLARHHEILNQTIQKNDGFIFQIVGDSFSAAFHNASDAVKAATEAQTLLLKEAWSPAQVKVRMGIHTGAAELQEETSASRYSGYATIALAQRVMSVGHGGQILISQAVYDLLASTLQVNTDFKEMGAHRLKDVFREQRLFQIVAPGLPIEFPPLKTQTVVKHNLPIQLSSFIGRQGEMEQIKSLLARTRLLTLLGPGGTGKTRLALQTAQDLLDTFPDGVWLVELASLRDPKWIPERVAAVLNVQEQGERPIQDTLTTYLYHKKLLLVLDNVEHLVGESARLIEHLLLNCPDLKILVTGREGLFVGGETIYQIPFLSLPNETSFTLEDVVNSEAVQLFLARAQDVRPDFVLNSENASGIAEIVQRLDGNPLALELAAVRLRMLTVSQINEGLNDRFRLLRKGRRTDLPRQQTLHALIDWSWQLLDEHEQILLRRLSVFSGGWNLDSAQAVAAFDPLDEFDVFDGLEQLINKSLVVVKHSDGDNSRYRMLESIRQFAQDRLLETSEGQILQDRFMDYFVSFSVEAGSHLHLSTMLLWERRLIEEIDNIRSALNLALKDHPELALRISAALLIDWVQWIHPSEAFAWLNSSVEKTRNLLYQDDSPVRVEDFIKALYAKGFTQALFGKVDQSVAIVEEGIQISKDINNLKLYVSGVSQKFSSLVLHWQPISEEWLQLVEDAISISDREGFELELSRLHLNKGSYLFRRGELEQAERYFNKAEVTIRKYQNPRMLGLLLLVSAQLAEFRGNSDEARQLYEQAIEEFSLINDQRIELILKSVLAHLVRRSINIEESIPYYRETIVQWQEQGNPVALAHQLECFAFIGIAHEKYAQAARLLGRAKASRIELNAISKDPGEMAELDAALSQITEAVGDVQRDRWMAEGAKMSLGDAVSLALRGE